MLEMMDAAAAGRLKGLWAIGYDVFMTNPNVSETARALGSLELVIVQDLFLTETAREFGTVFLPACSSFEKDGTFMNGERRVQRVRRAISPPEGVRTDWEIVCDVARGLGHGSEFAWRTAEEIWAEIRAVWPAGAGITYPRIEHGGLQWPCPAEDHPGTSLLHEHGFAHGPRARLRCIEPRASSEQPSPEYPFVLVTGRHLYQFNAGTMTARTGNADLRPRDVLDVSPSDAARLAIGEGDPVEVESRHGKTTLPAHVDASVRPGELFATFHTPSTFVNRVTGGGQDSITHTPEYKRTAVRIQRR
jgi:formate dehydrogenase major subunit